MRLKLWWILRWGKVNYKGWPMEWVISTDDWVLPFSHTRITRAKRDETLPHLLELFPCSLSFNLHLLFLFCLQPQKPITSNRPAKSRSKPDWLRKRLSNRSNGRRSCSLRLILRQAPVSPAGSPRRRRRPQSSLVGRWFHLFKLFIWERIDFGIWIGALIRVLSLGFFNWGILNWGLD